jgi:TM2 domain-containing membrane protein YozV
MLTKPKTRKLAIILALASVVSPISGLHKFYLGQPRWGILYLLLSWTFIPKVASVVEGIWYLAQSQDEFNENFNPNGALPTTSVPVVAVDPSQVTAVADALRQLDTLRQDGLMSDYEFEQKRRQLLDRLG